MLDRRDFVRLSGLAAVAWPACTLAPRRPRGVIVNDVHSRLNATEVAEVSAPQSVAEVREVFRRAKREGRSISVAGGRHAMGGQQFGAGTLHLDTRRLNRILALDAERGLLEVEAGIEWPELIGGYLVLQEGSERQWGIAQKQTGGDRFTIGGTMAANAHGRGLTLAPFVGDVEAFTLLCPDGELVRCSREENRELFALAIGGYGLFGVVCTATLRLAPRRKLERVVEVIGVDRLSAAFAERVGAGFLYGDFQFAIDPEADDFLRAGVFSCYRPVDPQTQMPAVSRELSAEDWRDLILLAHTDKSEAFRRYAAYYLSTSGQLYWSDAHQLSVYLDDYHRWLDPRLGTGAATEMITELYVPRPRLASFLAEVAAALRQERAELIYGTVRLIERDAETFLAWAREPWACTVMNLHVVHTPEGEARAAAAFRALIDVALGAGGSYYLTYHRWATRDQVAACHPRFGEFLAAKLRHDPEERLQSDWYRHMKRLFEPDR